MLDLQAGRSKEADSQYKGAVLGERLVSAKISRALWLVRFSR